jgi:predicted Zn-dependent peptidase
VADLTHVMNHVDALTPADLQAVARDVFAEESMQTLIYQ